MWLRGAYHEKVVLDRAAVLPVSLGRNRCSVCDSWFGVPHSCPISLSWECLFSGRLQATQRSEWQIEEHQVRMAIDGLAGAEIGDKDLKAQRVLDLELVNRGHLLYLGQSSAE